MINPNFDVQIEEPTAEDVVATVRRAVNGVAEGAPIATYNIKKHPDANAEEVLRIAAPHLFI